MKLYIITENGCEYNDETYTLQSGGEPVVAFKKKSNAEAECKKRNQEKFEGGDYEIEDHDRSAGAPEYFTVTEVECEDSDTVTYSERLAALKAAAEEASKMAKECLAEGLKTIFAENPKLQAFKWTQYTPYFNDGESCEFSAHTEYPSLKFDGVAGEDEEDEEDDGGFFEYINYDKAGYSPELIKAGDAVKELLGSIQEDDLKKAFGDHVEVTATRKGFEVDEYSHD